ncbi:MAG: futalosine hydrolase, partial [Bacteroidota bacterium]|nr:futalosine hydrolase [Bacteroidota bacterium]
MNILIVSATENEISKLKSLVLSEIKNKLSVEFLVTGLGIPFTIFNLLKKILSRKYDLVLNVGIAGALNMNLEIGSLVNVAKEQFGDLGIETKTNFLSLFDTKFISENEKPFKNGVLINHNANNYAKDIQLVEGVTVNTAHGNSQSILKFKEKYNSDIETMEGAAVFYVCLLEKVKFVQIRAISN